MIFNTPTLIKTSIFEGVMGINEFLEYQKTLSINARKDIVLISITEPLGVDKYSDTRVSIDPVNIIGFHDVLETKFWDIEDDIGAYKIITDEQALEIKEFIEKNRDKQFLIHCKAGQSRSAGVAKAVECLVLFDNDIYGYRTSKSLIDDYARYSYNGTVFNKIINAKKD